tara:strand:- start:292 stop:666 length:375 start_codon:yes stop_codon:yes gene_type:complete
MKTIEEKLKKLDKSGYEIEHALKILPSVKKAIGEGGKIYARVDRVSRSGMSRHISLFIIYKGEMLNLNSTLFGLVYGDSRKNGEVKINGCGMDMLFEATYRLYHFLFNQKRKPYQKSLTRYSSI